MHLLSVQQDAIQLARCGTVKKRRHSAERWPSGLRRTLGKRVYFNEYRGFESHSLRHSYLYLADSSAYPIYVYTYFAAMILPVEGRHGCNLIRKICGIRK